MGFSQHSELRMERRSLQRLVFQLGLQSLSLGISRFWLALLQPQSLLGVSLLGGYYPYWGYYPGWGGGHHHHPYPPHHRPNVVHRSTYRYGSGAGSNIGSTSFGGRGQGGTTNGYRNGTTIGKRQFPGRQHQQLQLQFPGRDHRLSIEAAPPTGIPLSEVTAAPTGEAVRHRIEGLTPRPSQPNRGFER